MGDDTEIEEFQFPQYKSLILINNIDINEIAVSNKFLLVNKISNIFLVTKIIKKLNFYAYFFPEMSIHKRYSDKTKCMYFMKKCEELFDIYMKFGKKLPI